MMVRFEPYAFFLLRIVSGILFILHGTSKILHYPPLPMPSPLPTIAVVAGILEIIFGVLITLGIFTTYAAFLASGEMAVAYFAGHALKGGFWPLVNGGELALLFCFIFLYIFAHGPGIWSLTKR